MSITGQMQLVQHPKLAEFAERLREIRLPMNGGLLPAMSHGLVRFVE